MTGSCNKNPFPRDGVSQYQRLPKALDPATVKIDGRSENDLLQFLESFSDLLYFYFYESSAPGAIEPWILKSDPSVTLKNLIEDQKEDSSGYTEPLYAIIRLFLKFYQTAQSDLNAIAQKHLEFYYSTVLGIKPNPAEINKVYLLVQLAKQVQQTLLLKGVLFKSGMKQNNEEIYYKLSEEFSFSKAAADTFKNVFYDKTVTGLFYASEIANSEDGQGGKLINASGGWQTFGDVSRKIADVGFAISSPIFRLAEGNRNIVLNISYNAPDSIDFSILDFDTYKISVSGEKGWIDVEIPDNNRKPKVESGKLIIDFDIPVSADALVPTTQKLHNTTIDSQYPVVRILLNENASHYAYSLHQQITWSNIDITVNASEIKNLILQNEQGILDATKPFQPFTNLPKTGSKFLLGSTEIFQKNITSLTVNINWKDLPSSSFSSYYSKYIPVSSRKNGDFKAEVEWLFGRSFISNGNEFSLFDSDLVLQPALDIDFPDDIPGIEVMGIEFGKIDFPDDVHIPAQMVDGAPKAETKWELGAAPGGFKAYPAMPAVENWQNETEQGFLKFILTGADFGHADYQNSLTVAVLNATKAGATVDANTLPKAPYTPTIDSISVNYVATASITGVFADLDLAEESYSSSTENYFHIGPFGFAKRHYFTESAEVSLVNKTEKAGELLIGIANPSALENLSMLVTVADGTANPDLDTETVGWEYLQDEHWVAFASTAILREQTDGLLNTGIVTLSLPENPQTTNNWMNAQKFWIRASVTGQVEAVSDLIDITTQAAVAEFNTTETVLPDGVPLPAGSISKLLTANSDIKKINQPYASFDGKAAENGNSFYTRVSERLRHKSRAVSQWDYERIALQQFSDLYKVKLLNHTFFSGNIETYSALSPGNCTLITLSNVLNNNTSDPLKPKTSKAMLKKIGDYLIEYTSPWVSLQVANPIYEEIKIETNVRFVPGKDAGIYAQKLEDDIKSYLCPWAYGLQSDIVFNGKIHRSSLIYWIEKLDYVDFVSCFKMHLIRPAGLDSNAAEDLEVAECATAASILVSADSHTIIVLTGDDDCDCKCEDNEVISELYSPANDCGCP